MTISRRYFLKNGGVAMLGMAALPSFLQRAVAGTPAPNQKKLVVLFQRGAMDGLSAAPVHGDPNFETARKGLAIAKPGQSAGALDLDGTFGLHPALAGLHDRGAIEAGLRADFVRVTMLDALPVPRATYRGGARIV